MKPTIIILICILSITIVQAQEAKLASSDNYLKSGELDKAKKAIDAASVHLSTMNKPGTWFLRGRIYHAIYESKEVHYKLLHDKPLPEASKSYKKALELDKDKEFLTDNINRLKLISKQFVNKGIDEYRRKKYVKALESFENSLSINSMPALLKIDTGAIFNTALAAEKAKNYRKAKKYYKKLIELRYKEPKVYLYLANVYKAENDVENELKTIEDGIKAHPENSSRLIMRLIDFYLSRGRNQEAIDYLDFVIQKEPGNLSFHYAKGVLYEKLKNIEKAKGAYKKAIELNPEYFDAQYNMGVLYYNHAVDILKNAKNIVDGEKQNIEIAKAEEILKSAIPYLEKAHEINPKDKNTIKVLHVLYDKLKMNEKRDRMKTKLL
jgi:tetratricopeptide (TPR) repeat protein